SEYRDESATALRRAIFTEIFQKNSWGCAESRSGPGSTSERVSVFRDALVGLLAVLGAQTLLDAPCGGFNWMGGIVDALPNYIGVDIVDALIAETRLRYGGNRRRFMNLDLISDTLPRADVILCRDALVHFSFDAIFQALDNFTY